MVWPELVGQAVAGAFLSEDIGDLLNPHPRVGEDQVVRAAQSPVEIIGDLEDGVASC